MSGTGPTRRSTGWSTICCARAPASGSIRRSRKNPAFKATGDLVNVPSVAIPRRPEYRIPSSLSDEVRDDLARFKPNIVHVSSPDVVAHRAVTWARARGIPAVASVHTMFETYLQYYGLSWAEPSFRAILRRFYRRCDAIVAPAESTAAVLYAQRMNRDITIWSRGVDRDQFNPGRRSLDWRREHNIADDEMVVAFLGRIVMEKGLDVFAEAIAAAVRRGVRQRVLVIGDGPARGWFEANLPKDAVFVGEQTGDDLAVALASADVFLNPSITEAFGNVTQEAMACALPVVAAWATGATSLVQDGVTGTLVDPLEPDQYGAALKHYADDPGAARAARRRGPRLCQDPRLGHDQRRRDEALRAGHRAARADGCALRQAVVAGLGFVRLGRPLDPLRGFVEDIDHFLEQLLVPALVGDAVAQRGHEVADRPADLGPLAVPPALAAAFQLLDQFVDFLGIFGKVRAALVGRLEHLLRILRLLLGDEAHVLEHGQSRIDDARARRIIAPGHLLDRLDQLVAVARLVGDQLEQHQAQLAALEHPLAVAAAMPAPAARPARRRNRNGSPTGPKLKPRPLRPAQRPRSPHS